jgi:hypothetical protein
VRSSRSGIAGRTSSPKPLAVSQRWKVEGRS